ncbi:MAG TPA: MinD/ParA family protein [Selenomonadales bacterium]|nr:MinD/ParA family protein [Selenomonadales bacterium]
MQDQAEKLRQLVRGRQSSRGAIIKQPGLQARVITVTSGKGGVGKTNLTVNLALALANMGQRVLILDADLGLANVELILGCTPRYNLLNLLEDGYSIEDIIVDGPRGVKFVSGGSGLCELADLSEAQLQKIINQVVLFDRWATVILVDTGAGIHQSVLSFVLAADEVLVVTTPEPTAIADAYALMKAYSSNHGRLPLKLVVNRVTDMVEGQLVTDKLTKVAERFLGLPIESLGFIHEDPSVMRAVKSQKPLILAQPDSLAARSIEHLAQKLLYGKEFSTATGIRGFINKFLQIMQ